MTGRERARERIEESDLEEDKSLLLTNASF